MKFLSLACTLSAVASTLAAAGSAPEVVARSPARRSAKNGDAARRMLRKRAGGVPVTGPGQGRVEFRSLQNAVVGTVARRQAAPVAAPVAAAPAAPVAAAPAAGKPADSGHRRHHKHKGKGKKKHHHGKGGKKGKVARQESSVFEDDDCDGDGSSSSSSSGNANYVDTSSSDSSPTTEQDCDDDGSDSSSGSSSGSSSSSSSGSSSSSSSSDSSSDSSSANKKVAQNAAKQPAAIASSGGSWHTGGIATWFTQNGVAGACGTVHQDSDYVVALPTSTYNGGSLCGKTLTVVNADTGKSATATVADMCPSCPNQNSLDLSTALFQQFASADQGTFNLKWQLNG